MPLPTKLYYIILKTNSYILDCNSLVRSRCPIIVKKTSKKAARVVKKKKALKVVPRRPFTIRKKVKAARKIVKKARR